MYSWTIKWSWDGILSPFLINEILSLKKTNKIIWYGDWDARKKCHLCIQEENSVTENSKILSLHKSNERGSVRIGSVEAQKLTKSLKHPESMLPRAEEEQMESRGENQQPDSV